MAPLLSSNSSSLADPIAQSAAPAVQGPEDRVQLSDHAKAMYARAQSEQVAADKLNALLQQLTDPDASDVSTASSFTVGVSVGRAESDVFAPKVSFASRLSIGGFSVFATGNADTWSSNIRIEGPNGLSISDTVFGGGRGAPTAESGGVSGLPPGTSFSSQKIGNKQYFTISSASAAAVTAVGGGTVQSAVAAEQISTTIVVDFDTGDISINQSDLSTVATLEQGIPTASWLGAAATPSLDKANAAQSAYTSEHAKRLVARADAERAVVNQLGAQVGAYRSSFEGHRVGSSAFDVIVAAGHGAVVQTGNSNDLISTYGSSIVDAGGGNDRVSTYDHSIVLGGAGNDRISAYDHSIVLGGSGNDRIEAYGNATLAGGAGNDHLSAYDHATLSGGGGNDTIEAYRNVVVDAGAGNDKVSTYGFATVSAGSGDDRVTTEDFSVVDGGQGNDVLQVGGHSTVSGGSGDDSIRIAGENTTVNFSKGDGHDVVKAHDDVTVAITGYTKDDIVVTRGYSSTMVTFKGSDDSLLLDIDSWAGATLTFADGSSLAVDA